MDFFFQDELKAVDEASSIDSAGRLALCAAFETVTRICAGWEKV